jgi:hypothetical protein
MVSNYIGVEFFQKRIVDLCLRSGLTDFPSKHRDQLIILKSIANLFVDDKVYTEVQVNQIIKSWLSEVGIFSNWDFMMLRRRLIDEKFLTRNSDGSGYWLSRLDPSGVIFDPCIRGTDICEILAVGQKVIIDKKAHYLINEGFGKV